MIVFLLLYNFVFASQNVIELESGLRTETNAFYKDRNKDLDLALYFKPKVDLSKSGKTASVYSALDLNYSKYVSNDELDFLEYSGLLGFDWKFAKKWKIGADTQYNYITEPPSDKGGELIERSTIMANLHLTHFYSDLVTHYLRGYTIMSDFEDTNLDYMVNTKIGFDYELEYFFLPETSFLFLMEGEASTYKDGRKNLETDVGTTRYLNDSVSGYIGGGLEGRLTEYSQFYFSFGYAIKNYEFGSSFSEPVFEVNFQEQITPQDTLIAGYTYRVLDSFYTNYELNQKMYLGYSRVFGDRIILLFRSNYLYKTFSLPNRREDQKLFGTVQVDFSYRPNWLIKAGLSGDILISDAIDQTSSSVADAATSYEAFQIFLATKVIF